MSTTQPLRIGGWLFVALAWLLMTLLSTTIALSLFGMALFNAQAHAALSLQPASRIIMWYLSLFCALAMWCYTLWLCMAFFQRRNTVRKHYILWLLICVLLAIKSFAFTPVNDDIALRQLLFPLLAAALLAPYFRYSSRVKATFINP
ncbi:MULTISPECIES: DUF2569 domain-containing protein [Tenebrionibacter/Tenebrionicola group]|jgi:hypothetical protein|uniref:DUF2569 domain-containing protein n=2 Tax=Tenebrionibacter/Tenebrionicola group TaxID=2969848 RepID=A0A8K0V639_9ENTR|nr:MULTISPECIES: DUF2569 domain-containing protein [Tenebrionibacter/Tenebrionicola group]MBK4716481.1 DUF2569 domain-containing protein [Tenebrionibacter intestinalis]MBV4413469.1 DUF2569 domain-containing protein [Tenebrionicola larvae]MBV5096815.1 DUF2569 domain-containing protein [Tenebrionicola larvae]